ncbi:MAG: molybdate ABC transporter permease subunit [Sphaerochaetaceae bacterium]|jgi:molybdate transport system permease protein
MFDVSPLWVSIRAAVFSTAIEFVAGLFCAHKALRLEGRHAWVLDTVLTLPMVMPPTVTGFFLLVIFGRNGFIGRFTGTTIIFTWQATVLAAAVVSFPLLYRSAKGAMKQVDQDHIWAARTLGFSETKILWRIIVPEAWPGIVAGTALAFARSLGEFGATMMVAGNIPGRTQTIPMAIYFATVGGDMRTAWIWVVVITVVSACSLALMAKFSKEDA